MWLEIANTRLLSNQAATTIDLVVLMNSSMWSRPNFFICEFDFIGNPLERLELSDAIAQIFLDSLRYLSSYGDAK